MRVTLLDDHQTFRESLRIALWHEASIKVVGESESARKVVSILETERPDLLVADLMLEDTDGISMARDLGRRGIATPVMILTAHSNALFVRDAFDAGVQGYALKEQPLTEIVEAMRKSAAGERYLSPRLGSLPAPRPRAPQSSSGGGAEGLPAGIDQLSRREREIFCLIIQGTSSRDIAQSLCISLKTVETHRSHINRKLGVHSPAELIRLAALKGLLLSGPTNPGDDARPAVETQALA
jgi:two-component system response regulator NreC